ncbi:MAG: aminoacyl-tRNA hydrolase [bacterium]
MLLIVGLGNPGFKFRKTRHNIGFMAVDALAKENNFPKFKQNKKAKVEVTKGEINGQVVFLAKPQTFMNNSGQAVKFLIKEHGFNENSLIIIHDDFDLPFGEVKLAENSGSGGHHGVQSIIDYLKTQNFKRIRIGIRPSSRAELTTGLRPQDGKGLGFTNLKAEDFVLKKFTKQEQSMLSGFIKKACLAINL